MKKKDIVTFEWDEQKNISNQKKHGVSFEEARSVFYDEYAWLEYDDLNSIVENRFRILGYSNKSRLLVVAHCIRNKNVIRIISSRKATPNEKREYLKGLV